MSRTKRARTNEWRQAYRFGFWYFDVDAALKILRARPRATVNLPVEAWVGVPGGGNDAAHVASINLDEAQPVVVAVVEFDDDESPLLIDGWHRLKKAHAEGRKTLPAYVLTRAETRRIRSEWRAPLSRSSL